AGPVAFTPAPARAAAYTPHAGVEAQSISGSYARFFLDGTVTTVHPGAGSGAGLSQSQGEELVFMLDGTLAVEVDGIDYRLGAGEPGGNHRRHRPLLRPAGPTPRDRSDGRRPPLLRRHGPGAPALHQGRPMVRAAAGGDPGTLGRLRRRGVRVRAHA